MTLVLAGLVSVATVIVPQMVWLVGMGITFPSAMAGAVGPFPKMAGAAAALQGFAMQATGAALSLVLAQLGGGAVSLGAVTFTVAVAGTVVFFSTALRSPPPRL